MPTYDYQCRSCGFITEVRHSILEDGPTVCERCGGSLHPVIHASGIIFKGGGFYKTDSRPSSSSSPGTSSGSDGSGSGAPAATPSGEKKSASDTSPAAAKGEGG